MDRNDSHSDIGIPVGLGMALAMNRDAMECFARLPKAEQNAVIERARNAGSSDEMRALAESLIPHTEM